MTETKPAKSPVSIINFSDTETEDVAPNDKPNRSINSATALEYSRGSRIIRKSYSNRVLSTRSTSNIPKDDSPSKLDSSSSDERSGGVFYTSSKQPDAAVIKPVATPYTTRAFRLFNRASSLTSYSDSEGEDQQPAKINLTTNNKKEPANKITETITKRLLRHRVTSSAAKANQTNNKDYPSSKYLNSQAIVSQANQNEANQLGDTFGSKWNWISYAILFAGILFFAFIFSYYTYTRYFSAISAEEAELNALQKEFDLSIHDLNIPGCPKNETTGLCSTNHIRPILLIIKEMKKIVDQRLTTYYCSSGDQAKENPYEYQVQWLRGQLERSIGNSVVEMELQSRAQKTKPVNPGDLFLSIFANALDLLEHNSKWFMKPVGESGKFEKIVIDPNYPKTLHPTCQVKLFMLKTVWYFVLLATGSGISFLAYFFYNRLRNQQLKEKELLFDLVEKSIELLQSPDEPQSLPILHIRDMLLNPQQRKTAYYLRIWDQVVNFIENSESRVKSALENIDGEDYKTWKWVATAANQPDSTVLKAQMDWQSNIFSDDNTSTTTVHQSALSNDKTTRPLNTSTPKKNNQTTSVISSSQLKDFVALTRFLKVRHMVDQETRESDRHWKLNVRNAIIQRCADQSDDGRTHGLQHIYIEDRNVADSLVYIKCDSIETASNAFKALHGFHGLKSNDQEMVSVKFLKEERFVIKFLSSATWLSDYFFCETHS